jgi:hypothetical protein
MTPEQREAEDAERAQRIAEIRARLIKAGVLDPPITDGPSVPIADQADLFDAWKALTEVEPETTKQWTC